MRVWSGDERLRTAEQELEAQTEFSHVVVNDRLEDATDELEQIVRDGLDAAENAAAPVGSR